MDNCHPSLFLTVLTMNKLTTSRNLSLKNYSKIWVKDGLFVFLTFQDITIMILALFFFSITTTTSIWMATAWTFPHTDTFLEIRNCIVTLVLPETNWKPFWSAEFIAKYHPTVEYFESSNLIFCQTFQTKNYSKFFFDLWPSPQLLEHLDQEVQAAQPHRISSDPSFHSAQNYAH